MSNETESNTSLSLQSYEAIIKEKLAAVIPEEKQLPMNEVEDYVRLASAANVMGTIQDIRERKRFANLIYGMVVGWLIAILVIIICTGLGCLKISDAVLLGLIGSTTVNVTAFFVIVTKYLFPTKNGS
jgi:hypothetical protein